MITRRTVGVRSLASRPMPIVVVAALLLCAVVPSGCGGSSRTESARSAAEPSVAPDPAPNEPVPQGTKALANALRSTTLRAEMSVRAWLQARPAVGEVPPKAAALEALYQQRIYRYLRRHAAKARDVVAALPPRLRRAARDNISAGRSLLELSPKTKPKTQPPIRPGRAEPPQRLLGWYRAAQR